MLKIYKLFIFFFILTISIGASGQINTCSPNSRFGLGDIGSQGTGFSKGMGGYKYTNNIRPLTSLRALPVLFISFNFYINNFTFLKNLTDARPYVNFRAQGI